MINASRQSEGDPGAYLVPGRRDDSGDETVRLVFVFGKEGGGVSIGAEPQQSKIEGRLRILEDLVERSLVGRRGRFRRDRVGGDRVDVVR